MSQELGGRSASAIGLYQKCSNVGATTGTVSVGGTAYGHASLFNAKLKIKKTTEMEPNGGADAQIGFPLMFASAQQAQVVERRNVWGELNIATPRCSGVDGAPTYT